MSQSNEDFTEQPFYEQGEAYDDDYSYPSVDSEESKTEVYEVVEDNTSLAFNTTTLVEDISLHECLPSDSFLPISYDVIGYRVRRFVSDLGERFYLNCDLMEIALRAVKWYESDLTGRLTNPSWMREIGLRHYDDVLIAQRLEDISALLCFKDRSDIRSLKALSRENLDEFNQIQREEAIATKALSKAKFALGCNHWISVASYRQYLLDEISKGSSCLKATCPCCSEMIPDSVYCAMLQGVSAMSPDGLYAASHGGASSDLSISVKSAQEPYYQYRKYVIQDYAKHHPNLGCCPKCEDIVLIGLDCKDVSCGCGHMYCVQCLEGSHRPCSCQELALFRNIRRNTTDNSSKCMTHPDLNSVNMAMNHSDMYNRHNNLYDCHESQVASSCSERDKMMQEIYQMAKRPWFESSDIGLLSRGVHEYFLSGQYIAYAVVSSFLLYDVVMKWSESGHPLECWDDEENAITEIITNHMTSNGIDESVKETLIANIREIKHDIERERLKRAFSHQNIIAELERSMQGLKLTLKLEPLIAIASETIEARIEQSRDIRRRFAELIEAHRVNYHEDYEKLRHSYNAIKDILNITELSDGPI